MRREHRRQRCNTGRLHSVLGHRPPAPETQALPITVPVSFPTGDELIDACADRLVGSTAQAKGLIDPHGIRDGRTTSPEC